MRSRRTTVHAEVLFGLPDDVRIEAVSLRFPTHQSLCISSQAGCALACSFCATGTIGLKRQLTADELFAQVLYFAQEEQIDSVSFMGMGEPLVNPNVFDAIERIVDPQEGLGLSARSLNVSTVGIIPGLLKLNNRCPQVNVAFSLHSPFAEQRSQLVPTNRLFPFDEVFRVLDERIRQTGRRVWVAYLLLEGENDSEEHAKALASLLRSRPAWHLYHVNLLPYNSVKDKKFGGARPLAVSRFQQILADASSALQLKAIYLPFSTSSGLLSTLERSAR